MSVAIRECVFYTLMLFGWVAISNNTDGLGWNIIATLGCFYLGVVAGRTSGCWNQTTKQGGS